MKAAVLFSSILAAGLIGCGSIEKGSWLPAVICFGWLGLFIAAQIIPERRGRNEKVLRVRSRVRR